MANNVLKDKNGNILDFMIPRYEKNWKILWRNAGTSISSGTRIKLNSDKYDLILWVLGLSASNLQNQAISCCLKGKNCIINTRSGTNISVYRILTYIDDKTYEAGIGYQNDVHNDDNAVPLMAIGITLRG